MQSMTWDKTSLLSSPLLKLCLGLLVSKRQPVQAGSRLCVLEEVIQAHAFLFLLL